MTGLILHVHFVSIYLGMFSVCYPNLTPQNRPVLIKHLTLHYSVMEMLFIPTQGRTMEKWKLQEGSVFYFQM